MPRVLPIDRDLPDLPTIREALCVLTAGGLVAFPTETVYGLGARGLHVADVARIFAAKERPMNHPLILHVEGEDMARSLSSAWSERASLLARTFWPGPLTLVVPRSEIVPREVTGGLNAVGLRAPRHPVALALIREAGEPLAAPSANAHMHVSPTMAEHVVRSLGDRVDLILDAGACAHGIESTVVDLTSATPRVLRPGALSLDALASVVPDIAYATVTVSDAAPRMSPGLAAKHYAPHAPVFVVEPASVASRVKELAGEGRRVQVIVFRAATRASLAAPSEQPRVRELPQDPEGYARELFAAFYEADASHADAVVVEAVPNDASWVAVRDRLGRAAAKGT